MAKQSKKLAVNLTRRDALALRGDCTQMIRRLRRVIRSWDGDDSPFVRRLRLSLSRVERIRDAVSEAIRS